MLFIRYCGVFGFGGHESARALVDESVSLVLAVGTSFNELDTAGWDTQALLNDRLAHAASSVGSFIALFICMYMATCILYSLITGIDQIPSLSKCFCLCASSHVCKPK